MDKETRTPQPQREPETRNGVPVIGISRHRLGRDGKGVTTLVAFHGCPLHCKYCLNPQCHDPEERFPRYTPEKLYEELKADDLYFRASNGGVTFGGGEPCLQADFIVRFRGLCGSDWKIGIETSLNVEQSLVDKLAPVVDEWIIDLKLGPDGMYEHYTGVKHSQAFKNLAHIFTDEDGLKVPVEKAFLKFPYMPRYQSESLTESYAELYKKSFPNVEVFQYITNRESRRDQENLERTLGPQVCAILKQLRSEIAISNGIEIAERECSHKGDCPGTCPMCELDISMLQKALSQIENPDLSLSDELKEKLDQFKFEGDPRPILAGCIVSPEDHNNQDGEDIAQEPPLEGEVKPYPPEYEYKKVFFKECPIAGLSFHLEKDDELWDELEEGVKLALVRQKDNKHDRNAVAVCLADDYGGDPEDFDFDFILGYVPRADNAELAAMMDAGYADKFSAEITKYRRHGNYNERIRMTIYIESSEPEIVRPNLLRMQALDYREWSDMIGELQRRGTFHFRWGGFPTWEHNLPIVGEKIVFVRKHGDYVYMLLSRVLAEGDECRPFLDDPDEVEMVDDCCTFVMTNLCGPIWTSKSRLKMLDWGSVKFPGVEVYRSKTEDEEIRKIFRSRLNHFRRNNIDEDPSIDEPYFTLI